MDWPSGCWQFLGDADQLDLTARQQDILDALKGLVRRKNKPATPAGHW